MNKLPLAALLFCVLHALPEPSRAAPPDSGSIMKEVESVRPVAPPQRQDPNLEQLGETPDQAAPGDETILVNDFRLESAESDESNESACLVDEAEIQAVLAPYKGRQLTLPQLEEAVDKVTALYRARGYMVARAFLPKQKAEGGTITIKIVVGTYGPSSLENSAHVRDGLIAKTLQNTLKPGKPVRRADLERAVLLTSDMPGADMPKLSIAPGSEPGTSEFFMSVPPEKRVSGFVMADNMGSRYTGRWRFGAGAEANSLAGIADKLSVFGLTSENGKLANVALNYALPLAPNGLRLNLGLSHVSYELGDSYRDLDATGWADTYEGTFSYPVIRSANQNLTVSLNLAHKRMRDEIDVFNTKWNKHSNVGKLGLRYEKWWPGNNIYTAFTGSLTHGNLSIDSDDARSLNKAGADTHGSFTYANLGVLANIPLAQKWSLSLSASGQHAFDKNLDSSEQFNITGSNGVKAYRETVSGDSGYLLNAEARYPLPSIGKLNHAVGPFVDHGAWRYAHGGYAQKSSDTLTDIGLGYYMRYRFFSGRLQLTHAVGEYPSELKKESRTRLMALCMVSF